MRAKSHLTTRRKGILGGGDSKCKGTEAGTTLVYSKNIRQAHAARVQQAREWNETELMQRAASGSSVFSVLSAVLG